jgi:hypothetical protein
MHLIFIENYAIPSIKATHFGHLQMLKFLGAHNFIPSFQVLAAVSMMIQLFWNMKQCLLANSYWLFGGYCSVYIQIPRGDKFL